MPEMGVKSVPKCPLVAHPLTVLPATTWKAGHSRKSSGAPEQPSGSA
jgi:hypothetical protein